MGNIKWRYLAACIATSATLVLPGCGGSDDSNPPPPAAASPDAAKLAAYDRADTFGVLKTSNMLVSMRDGFSLTCDMWQPANADGTVAASGSFPAILENFTTYGRTVLQVGNDLSGFAKKGYVVLWCNTRGSQGIGGSSPAPASVAPVDPFSPQEQDDDYDVIEWLAAQSWSNGAVGQIGTSYGGITALAVAGRTFPPHLKAIIPIMGTSDLFGDFVYPGGMTTIGAAGDARGVWTATCGTLSGEPSCSTRIPALFASHPTRDDFWEGRQFDPVALQVPTLAIDGFHDFWVVNVDRLYDTLKFRPNFAAMIGPWEHEVPDYDKVSPLSKGVYLAWFDRYLRNDTTAPQAPKIAVQGLQDAAANTWRSFDRWPPAGAQSTRLFPAADGSLKQQDATSQGNVSYAVAQDHSSDHLAFASSPFTSPSTLAGKVEVTLTAAFSATDGDLIVGVQDQAPDGTVTNIGYSAYQKASFRQSDRNPTPVTPGEAYTFKLTIPSKYWTFKDSHQMLVTVTSADTLVAPDAAAGTVSVTVGNGATYLDATFVN